LGTKFDIKKPELATADEQKNGEAAKIREGAAKEWKAKKRSKNREFPRARERAAFC
jgi:hypothetical protein